MVIEVAIKLRNNLSHEVTTHIPAGLVLEARQAESRVQNVVVIKDYTFKLRPQEERTVLVEGRCLNRTRVAPRNFPGRITPFRYIGSLRQEDIWQRVSNPRRG